MKKIINISTLILVFLASQAAFAQDGAKKSTYDASKSKPVAKKPATTKKRTAAAKVAPKKQVSEKSKQVPQVKKM